MKYRGKYSLTENFAGRGLGLLKESAPEGAIEIETPYFKVPQADGQFKIWDDSTGKFFGEPAKRGGRVYAADYDANLSVRAMKRRLVAGEGGDALAPLLADSGYEGGAFAPPSSNDPDYLAPSGEKFEIGVGTTKYVEFGTWDGTQFSTPSAIARKANEFGLQPGGSISAEQARELWALTGEDCFVLVQRGGETVGYQAPGGKAIMWRGQALPEPVGYNAGRVVNAGTTSKGDRYGIAYSTIDWSGAPSLA